MEAMDVMSVEIKNETSNFAADSKLERLVHLDLKGAAPKISYFEWLFPLIKKWGATGLLVEYEDMFPYHGNLDVIPRLSAYSASDIEVIQDLAEENDLKVIPLVQTFGHFEFVLKHDKFRHLREVENYPMTLCPSLGESFSVVCEMLSQVISTHKNIRYIHIGADEVFHIGFCKLCLDNMKTNLLTPVELFLNYIKKILVHLHTTYKDIKPIMWDDMFRKIPLVTLKASGIGKLVEPMVWYYQTIIHLTPELWNIYGEVFDSLWVASAFKGATGVCTYATDIAYHIENHKEWISIVNDYILKLPCKFNGFVLTGWQRYDHYSVLCELLPVSIPSLAICLLTFKQGAFTPEIHKIASEDLNFKGLIPMNPFTSYQEEILCQFMGCEIYLDIHKLIFYKLEFDYFIKNERLEGWMTDWHISNNYSNPAHIIHFLPQGQFLLEKFQELRECFQTNLNKIFFDDTTEEWLSIYIQPSTDRLNRVLKTAKEQMDIGGRINNHPLYVKNKLSD